MSSHGYPDYQRYAQWFGAPLVDASAFAIGAGSHTDGPLGVNNWSSVILYIKPTGGTITATVRQTSSGIGSGLVSDTVIAVAAGTTRVQSVVLLGNSVSLILQGSAPGETVDYSLVPSNTAVNTGTVSEATIGVQHNGVLVGTEPIIDLVDASGFTWSIVDDGPNTRMVITAPSPPGTEIAYAQIVAPVTIASVNPAIPTAVVSTAATAYDGTDVIVEAFFPAVLGAAGETLTLQLWDGATRLDEWANNAVTAGALMGAPMLLRRKLTPTVANHTYRVQGYMSGATNGTVQAGAGGSGNFSPGYVRVVKA